MNQAYGIVFKFHSFRIPDRFSQKSCDVFNVPYRDFKTTSIVQVWNFTFLIIFCIFLCSQEVHLLFLGFSYPRSYLSILAWMLWVSKIYLMKTPTYFFVMILHRDRHRGCAWGNLLKFPFLALPSVGPGWIWGCLYFIIVVSVLLSQITVTASKKKF